MKGSQLTLECRSDEVDAAYDILAEELVLKDQNNEQDLIDFENVEDDDVETMLNNLKKMGSIDNWEAKKTSVSQQNPPLKQRACRGNTQAWLISLSSRLATTLPLNRQVLWNATLVPDTTVSY